MKSTVEDTINLIAQNSAIVESALYDENMFEFAQLGLQRLMHENILAITALRQTLPATILVMDLVETQAA